ncbi:MAG: CBASS cGAMP-activated phospholipase [Verrucomicrobiales bacterium]
MSPLVSAGTQFSSPRFQGLAIDGGGFRGLFAAKCIAAWEKETGRRTADCFDFITGTSTGGIIALALGLRIPADEIVSFYLEDGLSLFPTGPFARKFASARRWVWPKLSSRALRTAVQRRLSSDAKLGDCSTRVVIPAFELGVLKPYLFKTDHHPLYQTDWQRPAWEIAMSTSAAPTYYPFHQTSWGAAFADGGLWANNPALIGFIEATKVLGRSPGDVRILNLGTGCPRNGAGRPPIRKKLGIVGWASDISEVILDANALATAGAVELLLGENFVRIAPAVGSDCLPLDSYEPGKLVALAEDLARFHSGVAHDFYGHTAPPYVKQRRSLAPSPVNLTTNA